MATAIVEKAGKNKVQAFVHGLDSFIYADTEKGIIYVQIKSDTFVLYAGNVGIEEIESLMKGFYEDVVNHFCSN